MTISTGGGGINIPIRIGMSPAQAQQAATASGRAFGAAFNQGFTQAMSGGGNPMSRVWNAMTGGIRAAGYGNYTGPRSPGTMAATYLWRGMFGRGTVSGMAGRLGATALGFGALGTLPQAIGEHIQTSRVQEQMLSDLNRRTGESFRQFSQFRDLVLETGKELGYTRDQIIQMTNAYVSGVGRMDQSRLSANLTSFMQLGKAYGIDPQAVVGLQTQMGRAGGGLGPQGTNAALAAAIEFGGMRGREQEVINSIEDLTTMLERRLPTVTGGDMSSMLGLMTQMNATGNQGLMGQRGAALMGSVDSFMSGSGGGAKQNLMFQMIQSQRIASGQGPLDYASLIRQASRGVGSADNRTALAYGINKFLPQGPYQGIMLAQVLGISPQQADDLLPVLGNPQAFNGMGDMSNVNAMSLPFIARARASGSLGGAVDVARQFAGTMDQRTAGDFMGKVNAAGTPEDVARLIAKYGDQTSQLLSSADQTTKAFTDFENSLTDLGGQMNKVLKDSLGAWTNIFNLLGGGAGAILDMTGASKAAALAIYAMSAVATAQAAVSGAKSAGNLLFGLPASNVAGVSAAGAAVSAAQRVGPLALAGLAARRLAIPAAILGVAETATDIMGGSDPTQSVLHHLLTTGGTIGGGFLGGLVGGVVGGGVGAVPGSIVGGIGGNAAGEWLWQNIFAPKMSPTAMPTGRGATGRGRSPFDYPISGDAFGVYSSFQKGAHTGVDFGMPQGTPVGALGSGTIQYEGQDPTGMGGNWLMVDYGNGLKVRYAHMSKNDILPVGSRVSAGDIVGMSGGQVGAPGSGTATTGPHLLMEAWQNGKLIDPMSLQNRPDLHTEAPMTSNMSSALQSVFNSLRLQGTLSLTVAGATNGQYNVPITFGSGTMAGLLNGAYGGS